MRLRTCVVCGRPSAGSRCARHALPSRARGRPHDRLRLRIAERDGWVCQLCHEPIDPSLRKPDPRALHVDHVQPRANQGTDDASNLRATHAICNLTRPQAR